MKERQRQTALRESMHPIHRAMLAEDVFPGTSSDDVIGWAIRAMQRQEPSAFEQVGRLIAPLLATADNANLERLKALTKDLTEYHAHVPRPDPLLEFLNRLATRSTQVNGVGQPMAIREVIIEARKEGFKIGGVQRFAARVYRLAPRVGLPIKGKPGNPTRTRANSGS